jgi:hypothetical protein
MKLTALLGVWLALLGCALAARSTGKGKHIIDVGKKNHSHHDWELEEPMHEIKMVVYGRIFCAEQQVTFVDFSSLGTLHNVCLSRCSLFPTPRSLAVSDSATWMSCMPPTVTLRATTWDPLPEVMVETTTPTMR